LPFSRKLKRLNLGGNELQSVPTSALSSFDMLKRLEMQENLISEISEGDFEGTPLAGLFRQTGHEAMLIRRQEIKICLDSSPLFTL
jgi:hypothetical protein